MAELEKYSAAINELCAKHRVKHLYAFGSVLTDKFNAKSDVDFIVDFEPVDLLSYADNYFDFKFSLQDILHRPVDLLEEKAISNPYFKAAVTNQRKLLYAH